MPETASNRIRDTPQTVSAGSKAGPVPEASADSAPVNYVMTRIERGTHKRLRLLAIEHEVTISTVIDGLIKLYFETQRNGSHN